MHMTALTLNMARFICITNYSKKVALAFFPAADCEVKILSYFTAIISVILRFAVYMCV